MEPRWLKEEPQKHREELKEKEEDEMVEGERDDKREMIWGRNCLRRVNNFFPHKCFFLILFLILFTLFFIRIKDSEVETDLKMSFPDPLLDSYNCPVLLRSNMHREHILNYESQELDLLPYTNVSLYEENQLQNILQIKLIELRRSHHRGPWRGRLPCAELPTKPCQCIFFTRGLQVGC